MTQILVSVLMWALVAVLLILRRGRADRSITYSAVTIAVAMTLNIDVVYIWVDGLLARFPALASAAIVASGTT